MRFLNSWPIAFQHHLLAYHIYIMKSKVTVTHTIKLCTYKYNYADKNYHKSKKCQEVKTYKS